MAGSLISLQHDKFNKDTNKDDPRTSLAEVQVDD